MNAIKITILITFLFSMAGCATPPQWLANAYNEADPCQMKYKAADHVRPSFCGKSKTPGRIIIYDYYSNHPVKY
jgi:starvation-inducible outer membrane lipoprotein